MGKIYTIMSIAPQNGAKYVATNLGFFTNTEKKTKVLLIDFDFENSFLCNYYLKDSLYDIDDLVHIKDMIDRNTFIDKITKTKLGFDVLKGSTMESSTFVSEDLVAKILILAKEIYTHIFVVVAPNFSVPSTAMTILHSNKLILVARNNKLNETKITDVISGIRPYIKDVDLGFIFNYKDYNDVLTLSEVRELIDKDIDFLGSLEFDSGSVDNINLGAESFLKRMNVNNKIFKSICKKII